MEKDSTPSTSEASTSKSSDEKPDSFARQTKFGVVKCDFFDDCSGKLEGQACVKCRRNQYAQGATEDHYVPIKEEEVLEVDNIVGASEFGEVRIVFAPDWKNVKVFINGIENKDVAGIQITAGPTMFTQAHLIFVKPKAK